jgi:hypothetical protein
LGKQSTAHVKSDAHAALPLQTPMTPQHFARTHCVHAALPTEPGSEQAGSASETASATAPSWFEAASLAASAFGFGAGGSTLGDEDSLHANKIEPTRAAAMAGMTIRFIQATLAPLCVSGARDRAASAAQYA